MKRAVISDVHSNLEALKAVLEDVASQNVDEIICLGDVVGYGPNPRECVDLVAAECQICILGNHDHAALFGPDGFGAVAERAIFWTRRQLAQPVGDLDNARRLDFLRARPQIFKAAPFLFVHGSARNPLNEYVFPEDVFDVRKLDRIFELVDRFCLQGHTHVPGVFTEGRDFLSPDHVQYEYKLNPKEKVLINVGSVGQPRDGDPRACYALLEHDAVVRFRRVEYPYETTIAKIHATSGLDDFLGDRLREGR